MTSALQVTKGLSRRGSQVRSLPRSFSLSLVDNPLFWSPLPSKSIFFLSKQALSISSSHFPQNLHCSIPQPFLRRIVQPRPNTDPRNPQARQLIPRQVSFLRTLPPHRNIH